MKQVTRFFTGLTIVNLALAGMFLYYEDKYASTFFLALAFFSGYLTLAAIALARRTRANFRLMLLELVKRADSEVKLAVIGDAERILEEMDEGAPLTHIAHEIGRLDTVVDDGDQDHRDDYAAHEKALIV